MSSQTKTPETLTAAARAAQLSVSAQGQAAQSAGNKLSASDARARLALATERPGNAAADLRVGDELDGSTMVLPVDAIHTYDRNPRLRENPKYLAIKESVRAQGGVTNQLTVTKRPGDAFYIPFGGGNTRVLVTQELWQETQDPKFKHLTVVYRKWRGDAANIAAHLAENNNRGDTSFWETAHGLWELKQELERELGRVLSATELNKESRRLGMDFGNSSVQAFLFAVEYLSPIGPWLQARAVNQTLKPCVGALQGLCVQLGCGLPQARAALDRVLELTGEMLRSQEAGKAPDADVRLDLDELVHALNGSVAQLLGVPPEALPLMLAARTANPRISAEELRRCAIRPAVLTPSGAAAPAAPAASTLREATRSQPQPPAAPASQQLPLHPAMLAPVATAAPGAPASGPNAGAIEQAHSPEPGDPSNAPATVREILADITRAADLADVVAVCDAMPLGYYVELPPSGIGLVDGRPCTNPEVRCAAWHVLAALSGQFDRGLAATLPIESRWREFMAGPVDGFTPRLRSALCIVGDESASTELAVGHVHTFFWHPELGELFLQLWSWALHWRKAEPARFIDRIQPLFD
jgi:ParB family protein of integrating conjugative element (PFGI_1 class)